jgi:hypothetical protein
MADPIISLPGNPLIKRRPAGPTRMAQSIPKPRRSIVSSKAFARVASCADLEQQVTDLFGVFARASWADGNVDIPFLNAGGLGIFIGDGHLSNPGLEKSLEAYYSYAPTPPTQLTLYQFVGNPGYNADLGLVNAFAARYHWQ